MRDENLINRIDEDFFDKPYFLERQWHLRDLMVSYAWKKEITGKNIAVCVVDSGIYEHPDLKINKRLSVNSIKDQPLNGETAHGTQVAGIIAAKGKKYVIGISPDVKLISFNIDRNTELDFINFALKNKNEIDIFNFSLVPARTYIFPSANIQPEGYIDQLNIFLSTIILKGRKGKGNIFVFAADNENIVYNTDDFDVTFNIIPYFFGQVAFNYDINNRYTIAVGALNQDLTKSRYSNIGSAILCVGFGSYDRLVHEDIGITTTFPKIENVFPVTHKFNGTSAAAPMVSGVIALLLEYRPDLTWRDVKELISRSCYVTNIDFFIKNADNRYISSFYGYGMINAKKIIRNAKKWKLLPREKSIIKTLDFSDNINLQSDDAQTYSFSINVEKEIIVETAQLYLTINNGILIDSPKKISDLLITLTTPSGTTVTLLRPNSLLFSMFNDFPDLINGNPDLQFFNNLPILTELLRGEHSRGTWTIKITDTVPDVNFNTISILQQIRLDIYGHKKQIRNL